MKNNVDEVTVTEREARTRERSAWYMGFNCASHAGTPGNVEKTYFLYPPRQAPRVITLSNGYEYRVAYGRWEVMSKLGCWTAKNRWPPIENETDFKLVTECWECPLIDLE